MAIPLPPAPRGLQCPEPPSTNPRILSGYAPYADQVRSKGSVTTREGRRQLLLDDPHARDVQPEQVTCTRCAKTVRLQKGKNYHLAHWLDHRWRCDRVAAHPLPRTKCLNLLDRKAYLEAEEDAKVVESDRVVCGRCDKEVKLRKGRAYGLSCWNQHKAICQMSPCPSVPPNSGSTSPSTPHSGLDTRTYNAQKSEALTESTESQRIKCPLCLAWIDVRHTGYVDVHIWHRHCTSCLSNNFTDDKLCWSLPRFFRPPHRFASGPAAIDTGVSDSSDSENLPPSQRTPWRGIAEKTKGRTYTGKISSIIDVTVGREPSPSPSPLPSLSSCTATSSTDSVTSTPLPNPRRGSSLFPNSNYLPAPLTTVSLSSPRTSLKIYDHDKHKVGFSALELHLSPPRPASPASHRRAQPPPYLERTPISLPIPGRYWRFEC